MDMADLEILNCDDLDSVSKLQKMRKIDEAALGKDSEYYKQLIKDCNQLLVDIENEITIVHKFIRDKYNLKFQELASLVHHPIDYARVVKKIGNETDLTTVDLEYLLPFAIILDVSVAAYFSKGKPLPEELLQKTIDACDRVLDLDSARRKVFDFVQSKMGLS